MKHIAIPALLALSLAACGDKDGGDTSPTNISIADDEGNVVFSAGGNEGVNVKLPGFNMKVDLPGIDINAGDFDIDGVKLYPGSTIETLRVGGKSDGVNEPGVSIAFSSPATSAVVSTYFKDAFAAEGITVSTENNIITGKEKDGQPFRITLTANGAATKGNILVASHDGK